MNEVNNRYSEQDLLEALYIWVTDYNKLPTHREISADNRMPTHHTYINRFGSIKNAFDAAGLSDINNMSMLHDLVRDFISYNEEHARIDNIVVDFTLDYYGTIIAIDIVNIDKFNVSDIIKKRILTYRKSCVEAYGMEYVRINNLLDMQKLENYRR